jgi:hypothetical protein
MEKQSMSLESRYQPNSPNVIYEVIDGEVVLVNLENGSYYSIDSIGVTIWEAIEQSLSVDQIISRLANQYVGEPTDIERGVKEWLSQLAKEDLIIPDTANPTGVQQPVVATSSRNGIPFENPVLHKYTDMEDLLLLDPIHDVDDTGWPNTNPNNM